MYLAGQNMHGKMYLRFLWEESRGKVDVLSVCGNLKSIFSFQIQKGQI